MAAWFAQGRRRPWPPVPGMGRAVPRRRPGPHHTRSLGSREPTRRTRILVDPRARAPQGSPGKPSPALQGPAAKRPGAPGPRRRPACPRSWWQRAAPAKRGQAVTLAQERRPRPASGGAELREQPRPPGCLCLSLLETNAPPAPSRPLPPAKAGSPTPKAQAKGCRSPRGSAPTELKFKGSQARSKRAYPPRLTSLRWPAASPRALPGRRCHWGPSPEPGAGPVPPPRPAPPAHPAPALAEALALARPAAATVSRCGKPLNARRGGAGADRGHGPGARPSRRGSERALEPVRAQRRKLRSEQWRGAGRRGRPMGRGQRGRGGPGATRRDRDRDGGWAGVISPARPHPDARYPTTSPAPFFSRARIPPAPSPGLGEPGPRPPSRPLLPPHTVSRESTAAGGARRDARARGGGSGTNVLPRPHCGGAEPAGTPSFPRAPPLPLAARVG